MKKKVCIKCKRTYPATGKWFYKNKGHKDGLSCYCKKCDNAICRKRYALNKEKFRVINKQYREKNKDKIKEINKIYREKNALLIKNKKRDYYRKNKRYVLEKVKKYCSENKSRVVRCGKNYYRKNKEQILEKQKKYNLNNKKHIMKRRRQYHLKNKERLNERSRTYYREHKKERSEYCKNRRKNDLGFKITGVLRIRLNKALKSYGIKRVDHTLKLVGCPIGELIKRIESQFDKKMTWDNYGFRGWHIDHIIPCANFDLTKSKEQRKCFHYTNLQPLWGPDNWNKNSFYNGKYIRKRRKLCPR